MTRDEAVKKAEECFQFNVPGQEWFFTPLRLVAALENLGLLKLEEPKSAWERFNAIVHDWVDPAEQGEFFSDIERAGLKIVEK